MAPLRSKSTMRWYSIGHELTRATARSTIRPRSVGVMGRAGTNPFFVFVDGVLSGAVAMVVFLVPATLPQAVRSLEKSAICGVLVFIPTGSVARTSDGITMCRSAASKMIPRGLGRDRI